MMKQLNQNGTAMMGLWTYLMILLGTVIPQMDIQAQNPKKVKVFLMAGQSNMQGHAYGPDLAQILCSKNELNLPNDPNGCYNELDDENERIYSNLVDFYDGDPSFNEIKARLVAELVSKNELIDERLANPFPKVQVINFNYSRANGVRNEPEIWGGPLGVGFGFQNDKTHYGPELMFGHRISQHITEEIVLIKVVEGGTNLYEQWRSPSAEARLGISGEPSNYPLLARHLNEVLDDPGSFLERYQGVEVDMQVAGFVWFQGWNDGGSDVYAKAYEQNLSDLITDLRAELDLPSLPVVIARTNRQDPRGELIQQGQKNVGDVITHASSTPTLDLSEFYHFDSGAQLVIGDRAGQKMNTLLTGDLPTDDIPAPWASSDIGSTRTGIARYENDRFLLQSSGSQINGREDSFLYVYQSPTNNRDIMARVSLDSIGSEAMAGLMVRQDLSASSAHVAILVDNKGNCLYKSRGHDGGTTVNRSKKAGADRWLKISKKDALISTYFSDDGQDWTLHHSQEFIEMRGNGYFGMVVANSDPSILSAASFDQVALFDPTDPALVKTALEQLTLHMQGDLTLTAEEQASYFLDFVENLDKESYQLYAPTIHSYMDTYSSEHDFLFPNEDKIRPHEMPYLYRVQFTLQQWIFDHLYKDNDMSAMGGVVFAERFSFPGSVSSQAPRVSNAVIEFDGDYQTNPAFELNDQKRVIRPTGYFVPAGEIVTIDIPSSIRNKGVNVNIGTHKGDLEKHWDVFNRFPRVGLSIHNIDTATLKVTNPFGGMLYFTLPDGSQLGRVSLTISGAVKAPYYSTKPGYETSLETYKQDLSNKYVPWVELEGENFMTSIPAGMAVNVDDPTEFLNIWNQTFDAFNLVAGRPLERFRAEYLLIDRMNNVSGTHAPAAYPMPMSGKDHGYNGYTGSANICPIDVLIDGSYKASDHFIILHEFGHLHNMPTLDDEIESNVNLPAVAVYNLVFDESINDALVYSVAQNFTFEEAALDWILTPQFRRGQPIGVDYVNYDDYMSGRQRAYQSRGHAKFADIGYLFGWEALGKINAFFYQKGQTDLKFDPYHVSDDEYIMAASSQLGINMAPLFEFWGILPSDERVSALSDLPADARISERLLHYRTAIPNNHTEFQQVYEDLTSRLENHHKIRYENLLDDYDEQIAGSIKSRIDDILCKYYADCGSALPAPWLSRDIGNPAFAGSATYANETFSLAGSGTDIWGEIDHFRYVYQSITGDVEVIAKVVSIEDTHGWAKAGVMIREGLANNASHASMVHTPNNGASFQRRLTTGGNSTSTNMSTTTDQWMRLTRTGDLFTAYHSTNGDDWELVGTITIPMGEEVFVGLAVTSHNNDALCQATFSEVSVAIPQASPTAPEALTVDDFSFSYVTLSWTDRSDNESGFQVERSLNGEMDFEPVATLSANVTSWEDTDLQPGTTYYYRVLAYNDAGSSDYSETVNATTNTPIGALPVPWISGDVGTPNVAGQSSYSDGSFSIAGNGEIWKKADHFHLVYQSFSGDGEIVARLDEMSKPDVWSRAGLMIRESLSEDAKNVMIASNAYGRIGLQNRSEAAGTTSWSGNTHVELPLWLKLTRAGNLFTGYYSLDGNEWTLVQNVTLPMSEHVQIGLAVSNFNQEEPCQVAFSEVSVSARITNRLQIDALELPSNGAFDIASDVLIYPNPLSDVLRISSKEEVLVSLTDMSGRTVIIKSKAAKQELNLQALPDGAYLLTIQKDQKMYTHKIIKN